jgi:GR25 family glycosyltransferase involved in LPS biosynthesis
MIFCLSHKNEKRKNRIAEMFAKQQIGVHFYEGVDYNTDPRIVGRPLDKNTKRSWSIMYGHLDMLRRFAETNAEFGVFCEDDIIVRKDFNKYLPHLIDNFKELKLDVLLLGNLCSNPDFRFCSNFPEMHISDYSIHPFRYYAYDSNPESAVWGTQMYMLHRDQAKYLVLKYSNGYADRTLGDAALVPFSADWTITKEGPKAIIFPLVAIENNELDYEDLGQDHCRKKCYSVFYSEDIFG